MVTIILIVPKNICLQKSYYDEVSYRVTYHTEISIFPQDIQTALMAASHGGHVKIVTLLHNAKADINFPDHVSHSLWMPNSVVVDVSHISAGQGF
jgi:ankyrin repeat protein